MHRYIARSQYAIRKNKCRRLLMRRRKNSTVIIRCGLECVCLLTDLCWVTLSDIFWLPRRRKLALKGLVSVTWPECVTYRSVSGNRRTRAPANLRWRLYGNDTRRPPTGGNDCHRAGCPVRTHWPAARTLSTSARCPSLSYELTKTAVNCASSTSRYCASTPPGRFATSLDVSPPVRKFVICDTVRTHWPRLNITQWWERHQSDLYILVLHSCYVMFFFCV